MRQEKASVVLKKLNSHARHVHNEFTVDSFDIGLLGIDPFKISQLIRFAMSPIRNFVERENNAEQLNYTLVEY